MPKIHKLPQDIIAKTAAGEVVERPASVVKELIENSLDAKASEIKILVENGGMSEITVIDDGIGMDQQDSISCLESYTTSKISSLDDLYSVRSLGFRGEALYTMSQVSRITVKSRLQGENIGTEVINEGGEIISIKEVGIPEGTQITVKDLFFNTPGRKKFIINEQKEFRKILDVTVSQALANPRTGFYLKHNEKCILDLPKNQTMEERINDLLNLQPSKSIQINHSSSYIGITGLAAKPQHTTSYIRKQYLIVNNRPVKNNKISQAVKEAFKSLIEPKNHPAYVLYLQLPFDIVDVNIHPRKEEILFYDEKSLLEQITQAVNNALNQDDLTYKTDIFGSLLNDKADYYSFSVLKDSVDIWSVKPKNNDQNQEILQVHHLYLITQTEDGIAIIDQHAAHERILYEQFLEAYEQKNEYSEELNTPILIELTPQENQILLEHLETLHELGFEIEEFGTNTYKVIKVPSLLIKQDIKEIIKEILEKKLLGKREKITQKSHETISYLACRSAIKAGDYLSPEERKKLIDKLNETKTKYTCPHGRPVKVEFTLPDVHKTFKR